MGESEATGVARKSVEGPFAFLRTDKPDSSVPETPTLLPTETPPVDIEFYQTSSSSPDIELVASAGVAPAAPSGNPFGLAVEAKPVKYDVPEKDPMAVEGMKRLNELDASVRAEQAKKANRSPKPASTTNGG